MKNGSCTIMLEEKYHGLRLVNYIKSQQKLMVIKKNCQNGGDYKKIVYVELLTPNITIDFYVCPELLNWKGVAFHYGNNRPHTSLVIRHNFWNLTRMCHHIVPILHHQTTTSFAFYSILTEKTFISENNANICRWKRPDVLLEGGYEVTWKMVNDRRIKWPICRLCFIS